MMVGKKKQTKYKNKPVVFDGHRFDSQDEYHRYLTLKALKEAGIISELEVHPKYLLQNAFRKCMICRHIQDHIPGSKRKKDVLCELCGGKTVHFDDITYTADFRVVYPGDVEEIEDVKGSVAVITQAFLLKRKMFELIYPDKTLKIVFPKGV